MTGLWKADLARGLKAIFVPLVRRETSVPFSRVIAKRWVPLSALIGVPLGQPQTWHLSGFRSCLTISSGLMLGNLSVRRVQISHMRQPMCVAFTQGCVRTWGRKREKTIRPAWWATAVPKSFGLMGICWRVRTSCCGKRSERSFVEPESLLRNAKLCRKRGMMVSFSTAFGRGPQEKA